jgi:hypothetical protein
VEHWQTCWERKLAHASRVEQRDWDKPQLSEWLERLDAAIRASKAPTILVAHSLGCALVAHWLARHARSNTRIQGALLVAPADLGRAGPAVHSFGPLPELSTPPPLWIAASTTDPYASLAFTQNLAALWRAKLIDVGALGHINVQSGHGQWPEGEALLLQLLNASRGERRKRPPHASLPLRAAS